MRNPVESLFGMISGHPLWVHPCNPVGLDSFELGLELDFLMMSVLKKVRYAEKG